ncbi:MAG: ATP-binding cassette domain-containing protein [Chryseosolibacter sp.]
MPNQGPSQAAVIEPRLMHIKAIDLLNVSYGYVPSRDVLSGISISIEQSTITAVLGKSGSGKSTLLQIINGMIRPCEGEVRLHGVPLDYHNIHSLRLKMGYVVQHIGLFPHMNIADNISILGRISKTSKEQVKRRVADLLDMVQLPAAYLRKYPHELSGGEQQRAGLCRALLLKPPILLMDEPFASLDNRTKQSIYRHLLDIQKKERRTTIIVTHDWEEAVALADRFFWIEDGRVKVSGDKSGLIEYKDTYFSESQ